jgi:excisionase family DNA binding protein
MIIVVDEGVTVTVKPGRHLTTSQAAKLLRVCPRTVQKWVDSGMLGGYRLPGCQDRRIPLKGLREFMVQHGMTVPTELNGRFSSEA